MSSITRNTAYSHLPSAEKSVAKYGFWNKVLSVRAKFTYRRGINNGTVTLFIADIMPFHF